MANKEEYTNYSTNIKSPCQLYVIKFCTDCKTSQNEIITAET